MLTTMRQASRGWIAGVIVALIGLALVITLIPGALPQPTDSVARGDGVSISAAEFDRELERRLQQARESGQAFTRADVIAAGQHKAMLEEMMTLEAIDRLAKSAGITVGAAVVGDEIRQIESFRNQVTGAFDRETYQRRLSQNGYTMQEFEDLMRQEIARRQLLSAVTVGVSAPDSFLDFLIAYETERRTIDVAEITLARVGEPPMPNDAELQKTYEASAAQFATPEFRALTVAIADAKLFAAKVEVNEADVRKMYDFARNRFETPETRSFVQVTAPNADAAREAARALAAGEDADKLAERIGGAAQAFDAVTRDKVIDPKVAAAVFAAREGAATGAIEGQLAWSAARVTAITPAETRSYEEVAGELRADLANEEAEGLVNAAVETFEDLVAEGRSLEDAAREAGLEVRSVAAIDAQGRGQDRTPNVLLGAEKDLLEAAFATGEGEATDFTTLSSGAFALARVDRVTPPGVLPLALVRDQLIGQWRSRWLREAYDRIVSEVRAAVAAGTPFARAAAAARIPLRQTAVTVDRRLALAQSPQAALGRAVFAAREGEVVSAPQGGGAPVMLIAYVSDIARPPASEAPPELRAQARLAVRQQLQQDFAAALAGAARRDAKAAIDEPALNRLLGVSGADAAPQS